MLVDGALDEVLTESWAERVEELIPARLSRFFFFDGEKIEALAEFRSAPDFESLGIAFKRVVNIVKGQTGGEVSEALFAEPVEKELFSSFASARSGAGERIAERDYKGALAVMKNLKEPVDRFFDNVMVMDKNEDLKRNRLSMLGEIRELFFTIADFSKLST